MSVVLKSLTAGVDPLKMMDLLKPSDIILLLKSCVLMRIHSSHNPIMIHDACKNKIFGLKSPSCIRWENSFLNMGIDLCGHFIRLHHCTVDSEKI